MKKNVAVIGAGVSGITTAVLLQHLGFRVSIYSNKLPFTSEKTPSFASRFPSASIIPHSVFHQSLIKFLNIAKPSFLLCRVLSFQGF
tara:strand:+ start:262 stop:522 length:261 start_codon:yes stop_codon:yes gene_type:complete